MINRFKLGRLIALATITFCIQTASAQDELRKTFFKDVDIALASAQKANASLLSPTNYADGMKDYQDAETGLTRGRNIEYVRSKVAEAEKQFTAATQAAELAKTVLSQVLKSRQDAATRAHLNCHLICGRVLNASLTARYAHWSAAI